jgi:hypothetical protein
MESQQNPNEPGKPTAPGQKRVNRAIARDRSVSANSANAKNKVAVSKAALSKAALSKADDKSGYVR